VLTARIVPCLDVSAGRVVKGVRFQNLRDAGSPPERAQAYEAQGADEIVLLDVAATPEGRRARLDVVRSVRAVLSIPLTVGGGVADVEDAARLLDAGADKVSVNSAALRDPSLLDSLAQRFGSQCTVLAIDAASVPGGGWQALARSGTEASGRDAVEWARDAGRRGAGEILLTSWDRDGTGHGYDLDLIAAVARATTVPLIASGGAGHAEHVRAAVEAGAGAVLAASIFHDGVLTVGGLKRELSAHGIAVRP
jgi:imidazoleglycerol phosphate synthase cyclase subunit